jgi:hypothetical protein
MDLFELTVLDSYAPTHAIGLGRLGSNTAIAKIPFGPELANLEQFNNNLLDCLRGRGTGKRPTGQELVSFGHLLFEFLVRDEIRDLYLRLPGTQVSLNVLTNHSVLRQLPWEYLQEPHQLCPRKGRSVVRIMPTISASVPVPLPRTQLTRVLFVYADPQGVGRVSWNDVRDALQRTYKARFPTTMGLEIVECTDRISLTTALQRSQFDIVQFSCHGEVFNNNGRPEGRLILFDKNQRRADYITGKELGSLMGGRNIRLAILSACESSAATSDLGFTNIAEDLISQGIPAVLANQAPVQDQTVASFVGAVYDELLISGNIDVAVTVGRLQLFMELRDSPEWGIPTLHRIYGGSQIYQ